MPYSQEDRKLLKGVGHNIRRIRKSRGLSQEALAFQAELDRTYIGSIERGERNVAIINLVKIARALEVEVQQLLAEIR